MVNWVRYLHVGLVTIRRISMPVSTSGLYQVNLTTVADSEQMLNVFWYFHIAGTDIAAAGLWAAFDNLVVPDIADIMATGISITDLLVKPIFGTGIEVAGAPTVTAGTVAGARMNNAYAVSFRYLRGTNETRSGWKRFSGLVEENVNTNSFTAGYLTLCDTLANRLANPISSGAATFNPVLVRRPFTTVDQLPDYYTNTISDVVVANRLTTQNSRKPF